MVCPQYKEKSYNKKGRFATGVGGVSPPEEKSLVAIVSVYIPLLK
jgi:hypothetical protein|tara:strand:+ start:1164 stop:1298 length:135 start_codon:yes stop_codon:yes gene_type:complete